MSLTPAAAAAELLRRRRGYASLAGYAQSITIPGKPVSDADDEWLFKPVESGLAAHHLLMCQVMERAASTRYGRFMFFLPPGSAKSTYASVVAPTYFMGKRPGTKIILGSYGSDLARKHGRRARQIVRSPEFASLFSGKGANVHPDGSPMRVTISRDSAAANEWALTNGSEYLAAGLLAGITGNRAHGALIDDPIKGREQADSPTIRDKTWEAYTDDLQTRLIPGGWLGLIQTRWHENDLAGRLLPKGYEGQSGLIKCTDGNLWEVVNLPAECEREDDPLGRRIGQMLWEEWFDAQHWAPFRLVSRTWAALFQQRPRPDEGGIFKEAWCRHNRWGAIPTQATTVVHSWDTAQKPEEINDFTVNTVWRSGFQVPGNYLAEVFRKRMDYPTLKDAVIAYAVRDKPSAILIEDKSSGQSLIQELRRNTSLPIVAIEPKGDKIFRAVDVSEMVESGLCLLPKAGTAGTEWLIDFEGEFFGFPLSTHKDQVDSVTQYLKWARHHNGILESTGAGLIRSNAESMTREREGGSGGYGSVSRGESMEGFNDD